MPRPSPDLSSGSGDAAASERWVSVEEVAAHVGVRKDSIYRWIENRGLPAQKIGKLWKLKLSEVDAWMKTSGGNEGDRRPPPGAASGPVDAPAAAASGGSPQAARTNFILIVDDDESLRDTLRDVVADKGYGALAAADGVEALRLLRSSDQPRPSLILLDVGMPNMDGLAFLEEQRCDPALAAIPVIIITAERRSNIGGIATLRKPVDIARLVAAIRGEIG
jgi:excisionase family DNA binding protein